MSVAERTGTPADASGRGAAFASPAAGDKPTVVEPLIFEASAPGRRAVRFPGASETARRAASGQPDLPESSLRAGAPRLPEVSELDLLRHFNRLSHLNHAIDLGFYPLGSCTMKYNPKVNEWAAALPGLAESHPLDPEACSQGSLELEWLLAELLREISGFAAVSLQPAAGAHGELTGMLMTRAFHRANGETRTRVLVPDSAHGTNPATASMVGYETVTIRSNERGGIDLDALREALDRRTAALMITNPSTLGIFEDQIDAVLAAVHEVGAIAYMDGANLNAILGRFRPGEAGFDVMHFNLHKTFSTPHGGGGPGAGPVGVGERLLPYLPGPQPVLAEGDPDAVRRNAWAGRSTPGARFALEEPGGRPGSIGRVRMHTGNFGMFVRAYTYIRSNGGTGLRAVSDDAVLAANYLRVRLADAYDLPYDRICKHEVVFSGRRQKRQHGVTTLDIAKAILDHGIHPPTIYFPLIVEEALMIEPTETESLETLDRFVEVMRAIAERAETDPEALKRAPETTPVGRLDEAGAARRPDLRYTFDETGPE